MEDFVNLDIGNPALAPRTSCVTDFGDSLGTVSSGDREVSLRVCLVDSNHDDLLQKEPVEHAERFLWPGHKHPFGLLGNYRKILNGGSSPAVWQGSSASLEFGHICEHDVIIKQILSHLSVSLHK